MRGHRLTVRLDDDELALLDERRPAGVSRAAAMRALLRKPPSQLDVASRAEALAMLSAQARDGKVAAAIALARELRGDEGGGTARDPFAEVDDIDWPRS